nr:LLM class flavin-dependent oxidoreductase [Mucilaginibacter sp.]
MDLISKERAEMVVGRGSATEAYPLFGFDLKDYDRLFVEKLELLLKIRQNEFVNWSGRFRPALNNLPVYPVSKMWRISMPAQLSRVYLWFRHL